MPVGMPHLCRTDANGQALAYVYFEGEPGRRSRRLKGPGHSGGTKTIALRYEQTTNLRAPVAE